MKNKTIYDEYMKDKEFERLMMQEDLIMDITEDFCELLEIEKINRSTLAKIMGKTKGYISQLLNGGRNLTLRSLADLAYYLGYSITIQFNKKAIMDDKNSFKLGWDLAHTHKKKLSLENITVADDYSSSPSGLSRIAS